MTVTVTARDDVASDVCDGVEEIAEFINESPRKTNYQCVRGMLPVYKRGGKWQMSRRTYREMLERLQREALEKALANARGAR